MAKLIKDFLESYDFNRAAIAKQRLANLRGAGRKVRGASIANLMRSARMEETELDEEDLDQLDEVLGKDASASDWISDFVHSDAPQFEGKTKKERIKMALAAHYEKQRNEEKKPTKEDPPWHTDDKDKKSAFKKPHNPNRTGQDSARALAQRGMQQAMKEGSECDYENENEKKKIKKQELKEFYDKIMAEINEMDQQITELEQQKSAKKQELNKFYESVQPEMKSLDAEAKELEDAFLQWKDGKSKARAATRSHLLKLSKRRAPLPCLMGGRH